MKRLIFFWIWIFAVDASAAIENLLLSASHSSSIGGGSFSTALLIPTMGGQFQNFESHLAPNDFSSINYSQSFPNAFGLDVLAGNDLRGELSFETGLTPYLAAGLDVRYQSFGDVSRDAENISIGQFYSWQSVVNLALRLQNTPTRLSAAEQKKVNQKLDGEPSLRKRLDAVEKSKSQLIPFPVSFGLGTSFLYEIYGQNNFNKTENAFYAESILFHLSLETEIFSGFKMGLSVRNLAIGLNSLSNEIPIQFRSALSYSFSRSPNPIGLALEFQSFTTNQSRLGVSFHFGYENFPKMTWSSANALEKKSSTQVQSGIVRLGALIRYQTDLGFLDPLQISGLLYTDWGEPFHYFRLSYGIGYSLLGGIDQKISLSYDFKL